MINKIGLCDQARSRRPCAIVTPYNARVNGQNSPRTTPSRTKPLSFRTKRSLKRRELGFGLELCPGGGSVLHSYPTCHVATSTRNVITLTLVDTCSHQQHNCCCTERRHFRPASTSALQFPVGHTVANFRTVHCTPTSVRDRCGPKAIRNNNEKEERQVVDFFLVFQEY